MNGRRNGTMRRLYRFPQARPRPLRRGDAILRAEVRLGSARERETRAEERRRRRLGLGLTLLVSALAHLAVVLPLSARWFAPDPPAERAQVRLVSMSPEAWAKNAGLRPPEPMDPRPPEPKKADEEPPPEEEEPELVPEQVVRLPPSAREERPEHADYASEYDQSTDRETRARVTARLPMNVTRKPQVGVDADEDVRSGDKKEARLVEATELENGGPKGPGRATSGATGTDAESGGGSPTFAYDIPRQEEQSGLDLAPADDGSFVNRDALRRLDSPSRELRLALGRTSGASADRPGAAEGPGTGQGLLGGAGTTGAPSLAQLTPSLTDLERVTGMPANDWLADVETDAETRLNAWRWKHATFFNRIADGIRRTWEGPELLMRNDPSHEVYGTQDMLTILQVTIDRDGNLVDVAVQESSGAGFLDDEAVRTFRETAPFANPPTALFRGGERFTFTFGFNVSYRKTNIDLNWRPY